MKSKRIIFILLVVIFLLLIPKTAMHFTEEVNWSLSDFVAAGVLLLGTGLIFDIVIRKIKNIKYRMAISVALLIMLFLIWIELAVGFFDGLLK